MLVRYASTIKQPLKLSPIAVLWVGGHILSNAHSTLLISSYPGIEMLSSVVYIGDINLFHLLSQDR